MTLNTRPTTRTILLSTALASQHPSESVMVVEIDPIFLKVRVSKQSFYASITCMIEDKCGLDDIQAQPRSS